MLPVCGNDVAVFHDGRAFSLPMAPLAEQVEAEVVVRRLVEALGGMRDAAVGYDGACGGVELWRVDVAEAIPRPSLLVEGLHHCSGGLQGTYNGGNTRGVLILMRFVCLEFFPWETRTRVRLG